MIAQRPSWHVFPTLCTRANASVRLVVSFHSFLAHSHVGRASRCISQVNSRAGDNLIDLRSMVNLQFKNAGKLPNNIHVRRMHGDDPKKLGGPPFGT